jgi:hypothetical protein
MSRKYALTALLITIMLCASSSAVEYLQPMKANTPIYSADGTQIGVLHKLVSVKMLRESNTMVMVEYADGNVSFVGWALKSAFIVSKAPDKTATNETATTPQKPVPSSSAGDESKVIVTPAPKRLTVAETKAELHDLLKVPVNYIQQMEVDRKGERGMVARQTESTKLYMRLNPTDKNSDGYAEITVLLQFDRDSIVTYFVNEKIAALESFQELAAEDYGQVIESYVAALQKYNEDLRGNFVTLYNRAKRYEKLIR